VQGYEKYQKGNGHMAAVGILGGNTKATTDLLRRMCHKKGLHSLDNLYKITENDSIPIVCIDEIAKPVSKVQVWIIQEANPLYTEVTGQLEPNACLIVNADTAFPTYFSHLSALITYGFNAKASVTASSVSDGALQVCIQRGFRSLSQRAYEPQEFKTLCPPEANPLSVLGVVTACAVCDILF
jgi:hypothetical protein